MKAGVLTMNESKLDSKITKKTLNFTHAILFLLVIISWILFYKINHAWGVVFLTSLLVLAMSMLFQIIFGIVATITCKSE